MGDRTYGQLEVVGCPPEHVGAVLEVINHYGLLNQTGSVPGSLGLGADEETLVLGANYTDDQMSCGAAAEIAGQLGELSGVAFFVSEDPKYEWLGDVHIGLPDGRRFACDADADQNAVLIAALWRSIRENPDDLLARLDEHFGVTVFDEFDRIRAALPDSDAERTLRPIDQEEDA